MKPVYTSGERRGALILAALLVVIAVALFFIDKEHRSNPVVVETATQPEKTAPKNSAPDTIEVKHKSKSKKVVKGKKKAENPEPRRPLDEIVNQ